MGAVGCPMAPLRVFSLKLDRSSQVSGSGSLQDRKSRKLGKGLGEVCSRLGGDELLILCACEAPAQLGDLPRGAWPLGCLLGPLDSSLGCVLGVFFCILDASRVPPRVFWVPSGSLPGSLGCLGGIPGLDSELLGRAGARSPSGEMPSLRQPLN